jgi:hypothetical protein
MKTFKILNLLLFALILRASNLNAQIGYYDAPYTRYEADDATLANSAATTAVSSNQANVQSEASEAKCVNLPNSGAPGTGSSVTWTTTATGAGLVVRFCIPDGSSAVLDVVVNGVDVGDLNLSTYWSWENLGLPNGNPKMRFDEIRLKLGSNVPAGQTLQLSRKSHSTGGFLYVDFAELEPLPAQVLAAAGDITYPGGNLQTWIDNNPGKTLYLPANATPYSCNESLEFMNANTTLKGAGSWYTQINFTNGAKNAGGLWAYANNISFNGLYLTTDRNSRGTNSKAINGAFTSTSVIRDIWAEHFECGAWIANYNNVGPQWSDAFLVTNCRFRNTYADGINLCGGTCNAIVEHCNFRNNGDDAMAIWPATGLSRGDRSCDGNTFRYNTAENTWRASGCAIYGGFSNKAFNLLIKDQVEVALKVNNEFGGYPFNGGGQHEFHDIAIYRSGTTNDLWNNPVGAIDIKVTSNNDVWVRNVKFSCINIVDSRNDAIYVHKESGSSVSNLDFENITINGAGRHGIFFTGGFSGGGDATNCGMSYSTSGSNVNTSGIGSMSWTAVGGCPACTLPVEPLAAVSNTIVTSATTFGVCDNPITLTANATPPSGKTVSSVQFKVDAVNTGTADVSSPYSASWSNPTLGSHVITAVATYNDATTSTSPSQTVNVVNGIFTTVTAPAIDGTIDGLWSGYPGFSLSAVKAGAANITNAADLSASFKVTRDATYLYVLIDVNDNVLRIDGPANWQKDNVELYIDYGNDKLSCCTYGGNDHAYNFVYSVGTINVGPGNSTGVTFGQTVKAGNTGYVMEVRLPWSTLGGTPAAGDFLGIEVEVNDSDAGPDRDSKIAWTAAATDGAWQDPSQFGTLQIAGCPNPLPVELLAFTGEMENETVVLNWATATELNNEKFIIERSSNLSNWEMIGEVAGEGNSVSLINYSFTDTNLLDGIAYYRLRQIDIDGASAHSNIVAVQTTAETFVSISPNPFEDVITIQCNIHKDLQISIYDVLGRLLYQSNRKGDNGTLRIQPELANGAYVIMVRTNEFVKQQKLIKN